MSDPADDQLPALELPRRVFIQRLTFFGGGVVLFGAACKRSGSESHPAPAASAALTTSHRSFTDEEFKVMSAAVDRILPADQDPGALAANVPEYVDRMLQSPELFQMHQDFVDGTQHLNLRCTRVHKKAFYEVTPAQQDELLKSFKDSGASSGEAHFYELLVTLTLEGFLGDPSYGGNKDHAGWELVGFGTSEPPPDYDGEKMLHMTHGGG